MIKKNVSKDNPPEYGSCDQIYSSTEGVVDNHKDYSFVPPKSDRSLGEATGWNAKSFSKSFTKYSLALVLVLSVVLMLLKHSAASKITHSAMSLMSGTETIDTKNNPDANDIQKIVYIIRHGEKVRDPTNATNYSYACLSEKGHARADHLVETFLSGSSNNQNLVVPNGLFSFNYDNHGLDCLDPVDSSYRTQATLRPLVRALGIPIDNQHGAKPDLCGLGAIADTPGISEDDDSNTTFIYNHRLCQHPRLTGSVHDFGMCCNIGAAEAIRRRLFESPDKTSSVLVAWEHANIGYLAEALMTNDKDNAIGERNIRVAGFLGKNPTISRMLDWPGDSFDAIWTLWFDPVTLNFARIDTETYIQGFGD